MATKVIVSGPRDGPCAVCGHSGRACAKCFTVFYCGREHQGSDWSRHRATCAPYQLHRDPLLGRHLRASRHIPAGTVLMRELPLLLLPSARGLVAGDKPVPWRWVCVGCCLGLRDSAARWQQCGGCSWPVCSAACASAPAHREECALLKEGSFRFTKAHLSAPNPEWLEALGTLRGCLARRGCPRLQELQSCMAPSPAPALQHPIMQLNRNMALRALCISVSMVRELFGLNGLGKAELLSAAGMAAINGTGLSLDGGGGLYAALGILPGIAMLEHSCLPNCRVVCMDQKTFETVLVAISDVGEGEHLTVGYRNDPYLCTIERQVLVGKGYFVCQCQRCSGDTELGLYVGGWCCTPCRRANKQSMVRVHAPFVEPELRLSCEECGAEPGPLEVAFQLQGMGEELAAILDKKNPVPELERFLDRHLYPRGSAHQTHRLVLRAKHALVTALSQPASLAPALHNSPRTTWETLRRKMALCLELLDVLKVLKPGHSTQRGDMYGMFCETALQHVFLGTTFDQLTLPRAKILMDLIFDYLKQLEPCKITPREKTEFQKLWNRAHDGYHNILCGNKPWAHELKDIL